MTRRLTWRLMILRRPARYGGVMCFERPSKVSGKKQTPKDRKLVHSHTQTRVLFIYTIYCIYIYTYIYTYTHHISYSTILSRALVIHGNSYCDPPKILLPRLREPGKPPCRFLLVAAPGLTDQIGISHYRKLETATGEAASVG